MSRRRRKRRNPRKNHSGLGALIGSVVGVMPGTFLRSAPLWYAGSIAGGALGGAIGAKSDRIKRGAAGGAIGGALLGPLGAGIGGYIGGKRRDAPKRNPTALTTAIAIGAGVAAVAGGYGAYKLVQRRREKALPEAVDPTQALQGIVSNTTLEEASFIVDDVQQPILLQTPPDPLPIDDEFDRVTQLRVKVVHPDGTETIEEPAGAAFGVAGELGEADNKLLLVDAAGDMEIVNTPQKAIAYLVTGLAPESARLAYELALLHIADRGVNWGDPEQRDAAIQSILTAIAPKVDWSEHLKPHTFGSSAWQAWVGVQTIGTVANQSYFNKQALAGGLA